MSPSEASSARFVLTDEIGEYVGDLPDVLEDALAAALGQLARFTDRDILGCAVTDMRVPKKMVPTKNSWGTALFAIEVAHQIGWTVYFLVDTQEARL